MGGLAPGIGGLELLVIALVALLVVGPKDLPMLLRKLGQFTAKARAMANEFRASFDEMARQSELDELRKEVEALRTGQGPYKLGSEADAAFKDIRDDLNRPLEAPAPQPAAKPAPEPVKALEAAPKSTPEPQKASPAPRAASGEKAPGKSAPRKKAAPKKAAAARKAPAAKPAVTSAKPAARKRAAPRKPAS